LPTYEYECECGKIIERVHKITNIPKTTKCKCGKRAKKILSLPAIQTDGDVRWLPSASKVLVKHYERPLETRGEYKQYLKDNHLEAIG